MEVYDAVGTGTGRERNRLSHKWTQALMRGRNGKANCGRDGERRSKHSGGGMRIETVGVMGRADAGTGWRNVKKNFRRDGGCRCKHSVGEMEKAIIGTMKATYSGAV